MKRGDIISIPFPFTDQTTSKRRPCLVLWTDGLDVLVAFITSNVDKENENDVVIAPNALNGLKVDSVVVTNKLASLERTYLKGILGHLTLVEYESVVNGILKNIR